MITGNQEGAVVERLLTADDVAAALGVPRSLVYALARRGDLPVIRVGGRYVRFRASAISGWIENREAGGTNLAAASDIGVLRGP